LLQVKIKFNIGAAGLGGSSTQRVVVAAPTGFSGVLMVALAVLVASPIDRVAAQASSTRTFAFREGADWIRAERERPNPETPAGLSPVLLHVRGEPLRAHVGRRALLQLSPEAWLSARSLLATRGLRPIEAPYVAGSLASRALGPGVSEQGAPLSAPLSAAQTPGVLSAGLRLLWVEGRPGEDGLDVAVRMSRVAGVETAAPDLYLRRKRADFELPPDDPRYSGQWYLADLKIEQAWEHAVGDADTSILIVDDGCDMTHPDLVGALVGGRDVIDEDDDPSYSPDEPGNEHGTACAGVAAATGNNGLGIAGVCPQCSLYCVRLFESSHSLVPISADIAAFEYALDVGAAVVSNSWGFAEPGPVPALLRGAIQRLLADGRGGRGAVVVFAAGNENREIGSTELAAISGVLNVGAINNFDEAAPFSNYGASLALTAPTGSLTTDIQGTDGAHPTDYTNLFGGTSAACPVVAGVAALVLSAAPELSGAEVNAALIATARPAPFATPDANNHDPLYGYGIVDPGAALRSVLGLPEPAEPSEAPDAGASEPADAGAEDSEHEHEAQDPEESDGCSVHAARSGSGSGLLAWFVLGCVAASWLRTCSRSRR
jgi:serine protease